MKLGTPERVPPHSQECERAVLGAVLADNTAMDKCAGISADDFYDPIHGLIFSACKRRIEKGRLADALTLKEALADSGAMDEVGGHKYLVQLIGCSVSPKWVEPYVERIRECALLRRTIGIFEKGIARAYTPTAEGDDAASAITEAMVALEGAGAAAGLGRPMTLAEAVNAAVALSDAAHKGDKRAIGLTVGIPSLDGVWGGLHPGALDIIGARSRTGKTALALQFARHVSAKHGPVAIYSGEMTSTDMAFFNLSSATGMSVDSLRQGTYPLERASAIIKAQSELAKLPIHIMDTPQMPCGELVSALRALKRQHGIKLAIIDHRDLIGRDPGFERTMDLDWFRRLTPALKAAAKSIGIPIILLVQLVRDVERREDKTPVLSDLIYTGEQDADNILLLHRPELYDKPATRNKGEREDDFESRRQQDDWRRLRERGMTLVKFVKRRFGPEGQATLRFDGPRLTFGEWSLRNDGANRY